MEEETLVVLIIQLTALSCIAVALVLYLLCKVNRRNHTYDTAFPALNVGTGRSVLVTNCDTVFGIQLALHLTSLGFRVFAGTKPKPTNDESEDRFSEKENECSEAIKILKAKLKHREAMSTALIGVDGDEYVIRASNMGTLITVPLDVTREDSLHDALDEVRRHLPAGENGLWAVINTAGVCYKGKLDQQDSYQWEMVFKVNVFGMLRTARTFMNLLKDKKGRLLTIGTGRECKNGNTTSVVYNAARHAVAGASASLAQETASLGVHVITIHTESVASEKLFTVPILPKRELDKNTHDRYAKYDIAVVPDYALDIIEEALLVENPKSEYTITKPTGLSNYLTVITQKLEHMQKRTYNIGETVSA